jgi:hypothetical protein
VNRIVAGPTPELPLVTLSQDAPLSADQGQPASVTRFTVRLPPVCENVAEEVANWYVQVEDA